MRKELLFVILLHFLSLELYSQDLSATIGTKLGRTIRLEEDISRGWFGERALGIQNSWQPALCINGKIQVRPAFFVGVEFDLARNSFNFNPDLGRKHLGWNEVLEQMNFTYTSLNVMPYVGLTKGHFDLQAQFVLESSLNKQDIVRFENLEMDGADTLRTSMIGEIGRGKDFYQQFSLRYRLDSVKNKHLQKVSISVGYGMRFLFPRASSNHMDVDFKSNSQRLMYNYTSERRRNAFIYIEYRFLASKRDLF